MIKNIEEWEAKLLDDENQPEFYDTLEVLNLKDNIDKVAKATVIVYIFISISSTHLFTALILGEIPSLDSMPNILWNFFIAMLVTGISIALVYFPLKALSHILRILMEMEFNSRKAKQ